jgi:hypothetical protein
MDTAAKKTLYFTSSTSITMPLIDGSSVAYTGLYKCTLNENHEENDSIDGDDQQQCRETEKVADGRNRDGKPHAALPLHNLQFHNGNRETKNRNKNDRITNSRPSYLYANTYIDKRKENPDGHVGSWEILRAAFPGNNEESGGGNGLLRFESVFRTLEAFDWNECGFKCCRFNSNADDDPFEYSRDEENMYYSHTHAYVRTIPRSFAVDETTGEIFVSWEGFYQNCDPAGLAVEEKTLQWTIGVSRLRTEDPYCVTDQVGVMENNFPRCTEPVSIVYQSSRGREAVLPNGGFTVIPAAAGGDGGGDGHRRIFLLSALTSPGIQRGELESHVWAVTEGGNRNQEQRLSLLNGGNGTSIDHIFMDEGVWDGGTLRLHYNLQTGRPDHLCRSIFNKGIGCMPILVDTTITGDNNHDSVNIITPLGEEDIVLTEDQVNSFCRLKDDADRTKSLDWGRKTTLVTGLEIVWNEEEEDGTGFPQQIIFGCFGGKSGNGNFGIINVDHGEGDKPPLQVMEGAYPGAVLFLPQEMEPSLTSSSINHTTTDTDFSDNSTDFQNLKISYTQLCSMLIVFLLLGFLLCIHYSIFHSKRRCSKRYHLVKSQSPQNLQEKESLESVGIYTPYMELPTIDSSSCQLGLNSTA